MKYNLYVFENYASVKFDEFTNNFLSAFKLYKTLKRFYINKMKSNKNVKVIFIKLVKYDDCLHLKKTIRKDEIYNGIKR